MTTSKALVFDIKRFAVHDGMVLEQPFSLRVVPFIVYGVKIPRVYHHEDNLFIFKTIVYIVAVSEKYAKCRTNDLSK